MNKYAVFLKGGHKENILMNKYAVFLKGGCNQTLKILEAQNLSQAKNEIKKLLEDYAYLKMYMSDEIIIFEGEQYQLGFIKWLEEEIKKSLEKKKENELSTKN